jgi:hypothetical protein
MPSLPMLLCLAAIILPPFAIAETPLPLVHDGAVLTGPGEFRHDGELFIQGKVTLRQMKLALHGPVRVAAGATLELDDATLHHGSSRQRSPHVAVVGRPGCR